MNYTIIFPGLLGDAVMATPALHAFRLAHPNDEIHLRTFHGIYDLFRCHEDADSVAPINAIEWEELTSTRPLGFWWQSAIDGVSIILDAGVSFKCRTTVLANSFKGHMLHGYGLQLGANIKDPHYRVTLTKDEIDAGRSALLARSGGKPVIICTPYSKNCNSRLGLPANKMLDFSIWEDVRRHFAADYHLLFISGPDEPEVKDIQGDWACGFPIREVASWLPAAKLCITLVNGVGHLAAALDSNIVRIQENLTLDLANYPTRGKYAVVDHTAAGGISTVKAEHIIRAAESLLH